MRLSFILPSALLLLLLEPCSSLALPPPRTPSLATRASPRWNGVLLPDSEGGHPFLPYWKPEGSSSFDDDDLRAFVYSPEEDWKEYTDEGYHGGNYHATEVEGAYFEFEFEGVGVEYYGGKDSDHGFVEIYLDSTFVARVDTYHPFRLRGQAIFRSLNLSSSSHILKVVNVGRKNDESQGTWIDVDAIVVTPSSAEPGSTPSLEEWTPNSFVTEPQGSTTASDPSSAGLDALFPRDSFDASTASNSASLSSPQPGSTPTVVKSGSWKLVQEGNTGVAAMQLTVLSETYAMIIDKVEHNLIDIEGQPAWAALYNLKTNQVTPIDLQSNSFCAGGTFLGNGTLISVGGNAVTADTTGAADFGDTSGYQSARSKFFFFGLRVSPTDAALLASQVRILEGCDDPGRCSFVESPRLRMASPRWYPSTIRLSDGAAMILGGSGAGGWINNKTANNPSFEFFPPRGDGLPVLSPFLHDTLNSNLFPIAFSLPDGKVFIAANQDSMIYDVATNTERRLPLLPNGQRVTYPMTGAGVLLPMSEENDWQAEILICGGSTVDDTIPMDELDSGMPASDQCSRMILSEEGISRGWQVEKAPHPWMMADAVLLPDGTILFVNGCKSGIAGYGNVRNQVGQSNCADPAFTPSIYTPSAPLGSRFSSYGLPTSSIPRVYHSVATLVPDGRIMIAGSNPNLDRTTTAYPTEYRVEWLSPPYLSSPSLRPSFSPLSSKLLPFASTFTLRPSVLSSQPKDVRVVLMDLGFITHSVRMNSRLLYLPFSIASNGKDLVVKTPDNGMIYPPGPGFLYLVVDGVPSLGAKVIVGSGEGPVVDENARKSMLSNPQTSSYGFLG